MGNVSINLTINFLKFDLLNHFSGCMVLKPEERSS
jgi:hypothetical protein